MQEIEKDIIQTKQKSSYKKEPSEVLLGKIEWIQDSK